MVDVYLKVARQTYLVLKDSARTIQTSEGDYKRDGTFKHKIRVYANDGLKKVVIGRGGTNPKDKEDIMSDLKLFMGKETRTPHYKALVKAYDRVVEKYPGYKIYVTGHSLAGRTVIALIENNDRYKRISGVYAFNPGSSFTHLVKSWKKRGV